MLICGVANRAKGTPPRKPAKGKPKATSKAKPKAGASKKAVASKKTTARKPAARKATARSVAAAEIGGAEVPGVALGDLYAADDLEPVVDRSPVYLRSLLLLLLAATFFEGYDGAILSLVLGSIRDTFNVAESALGVSRAIIELGLGAAFFLARAGDRWGRRKLLLWSVFGYTVMTALTAASWNLVSFTAFQSLSRVFLGAEYAVALTMIVEEFPKDRRARVLGIFLMCSAIGAVVVDILLLAGVDNIEPLKWRTLYLIGLLPLVVLGVLRRKLQETGRFEQYQAAVKAGKRPAKINFFEPWRKEYRRTLVLVGLIHLMRSLPLYAATSWFFYFANREGRLPNATLYAIFLIAYTFGTLGYLMCGRAMERYGRRPTAIVYGIVASAASIALFQSKNALPIGVLLVVAVFFGLGMAPVLGAVSTELFPTYIRNQSAAWSRNVFEIAGFILGPLLVGVLGDHYTGALGSVGDTVTILMLLFIPATWLIWRHLPESRGRELEEIEHDLGIADVAKTEAESTGPSPRSAFIFAGAFLVVFAGVFFGVRALGDISRHPDGAAERFLQAVDAHDADEINQFGSVELAKRFFGADYADKDFDTIEVGHTEGTAPQTIPFKVVLDDDKLQGDAKNVYGHLTVTAVGAADPPDLKVTASPDFGPTSKLTFDVAGGTNAPIASWPIAAVVVFGFTLIAEAVLKALRTK